MKTNALAIIERRIIAAQADRDNGVANQAILDWLGELWGAENDVEWHVNKLWAL